MPWQKLALCISWGVEDDVQTVRARAPGMFTAPSVNYVLEELTQPNVVVVGHNALKFDLPLLAGIARRELPAIQCQDTLNDIKYGMAYSNSLKNQCDHYDINLKKDSPDWRKIIQRDLAEWNSMVAYCENDVVCTLQLERALDADGLTVPVKTWFPRKGRYGA